MRAICLGAALVLWLGASNTARADWLATSFDQPVAETLHAVDIDLEDGVAVYTVRRTLVNDGRERDEVTLTIELPVGGSVSGLRVKTGGRWIPSRVMDAEDAADRYEELRLPGDAKPRLAAELRRDGTSAAELRLFPLAARRSVTVEYTVIAPVHWHDGRIYLHVPRGGGGGQDEGLAKPSVRIDPKDATRLEPVAPGTLPQLDPESFSDWRSDHEGWMSAVPARPPRTAEVRARYATWSLSSGKWLWRLEIDVAAMLGEAPRDARVLFVIDASRSAGKDGIRAQLDLARGYLEHVPDAMFEIVVFRRRAMRLFGRWQPAGELDEALAELPEASFLPGNGSALEAGLALAVEIAAKESRGRPVRVVAMTDGLLREGFEPAAAADAIDDLPANAVVHLIDRGEIGGPVEEGPLDDGPLVDVAGKANGRATALLITGDASLLPDAAQVMRGVVRPIRIDDVTVDEEGAEDVYDVPEVLDEGEAVRRMDIGDPGSQPPRSLTLRGRIWGREIVKTVNVDPGFTRRLPALVLASDLEAELEDEEVLAIATAAGLLSRMTSLFVEEPGAAPHTAGYEVSTGSSFETISTCGCSFTVSGCAFGSGRHRARRDLEALLRARLEPAVATCTAREGVPRAEVEVTVETTHDEVVDVSATGEVPQAALTCAEEAAWSLTLDARFSGTHRIPVLMRVGDGDDAPPEPQTRPEDFLL